CGRLGDVEPRRAVAGGPVAARIFPARTQERPLRLTMKTSNEEKPSLVPDVYPLDDSYPPRNEPAPVIARLEGAEVPDPYQSLLVHKTDMTSTLEKYYGETLHVEVLRRELCGNEYTREV